MMQFDFYLLFENTREKHKYFNNLLKKIEEKERLIQRESQANKQKNRM